MPQHLNVSRRFGRQEPSSRERAQTRVTRQRSKPCAGHRLLGICGRPHIGICGRPTLGYESEDMTVGLEVDASSPRTSAAGGMHQRAWWLESRPRQTGASDRCFRQALPTLAALVRGGLSSRFPLASRIPNISGCAC